MNLNENEDQPNEVNDQQPPPVEVVNENPFSSLEDDKDKPLLDTPEKTQNQPQPRLSLEGLSPAKDAKVGTLKQMF